MLTEAGSYGSLPLPVLGECNKLTLLSESNPDKFHRVTYMSLLAKARYVTEMQAS